MKLHRVVSISVVALAAAMVVVGQDPGTESSAVESPGEPGGEVTDPVIPSEPSPESSDSGVETPGETPGET
ncbi:hypothetical protein GGH19_000595, partial [Coemansia sp. RSA 1807]